MIPLQEPMKIDQLEYFGIPSYIITIWKKHYSSALLPVQEEAVRRFHLLKSAHTNPFVAPNTVNQDKPESLLVVSASSSGKTLIGEMAAIQEMTRQQKVIFLVPLRILVEEKYQHFLHLYQSIGLQIKKSSRDYRHNDKDIITGHFHIAVMVYEKFYYLLLQYPQILQNISLLIADEIQLINDPQRGPCLENILGYLKANHPGIRIIALSALNENIHRLKNWLGIPVLFSSYRPAALRKGIIRHGIYHYIEHNTGTTGTEIFFCQEEAQAGNLAAYLKATLDYLLKQDQTNLVFFPTRKEARRWSKWLAGEFALPPAQSAIEELGSMEESVCRQELTSLLEKGISYHCAALCWQQRHLIEQATRRGDIKIICATGTLAMGVNLPVDNVILTGRKVICQSSNTKTNHYAKRMLTPFEAENMGGRAGRFDKQDHFGRMIFLAPSPIAFTAYQRHYFSFQETPSLQNTSAIGPGISGIKSPGGFRQTGPEEIPLKTEPDIFTFLLHGIALNSQSVDEIYNRMLPAGQRKGKYFWSYQFKIKTDLENLWGFLYQLEKEHLIRIHDKKTCHIAPMGSLIISKGISYQTYLHLKKWLDESREYPADNLEILFSLATSFDGKQLYIPSCANAGRWSKGEKHLREKEERYFTDHISGQISRQGAGEDQFKANHRHHQKNYPAIKKTLLILDWIEGKDLIDIEQKYGILHGDIENIAEGFSWLGNTLSAIAVKTDWKNTKPDSLRKIRQLSRRISSGVKSDGLGLAGLHIPGLSRGYIHRLVEEGYDNKQCLQELTEKQLSPLLPKRLIAQIKRYLSSDQDRDLALEQKELPKNLKVLKDLGQKKHFAVQPNPAKAETPAVIFINPDRPDQICFLQEAMKVNRMNFRLILLLVKNQGKLISYEKIIDTLWPDDEDATYHRLWYHLAKLRGGMQKIIREKNLSKDYLKENILKVFPGRGLLLENDIKTMVQEK